MSYERQRDRLREELTLAEMELSQVVVEQLDVKSILGFAEIVLTDTARLWSDAGLNEKQLLQQAIFPEGLRFDGERFGTAVTCLAFKQLELSFEAKSEVASPKGIEYFYTLVGSALKAA